jgi:tetratricopeptide (TPR) repeat protein
MSVWIRMRSVRLLTGATATTLIAVAASSAPAYAQAPSTPRVLVLPFATQTDASASGSAGMALWLREAAAVLLADELDQLGVGAFSRDQRVAAFDQLQLPVSGSFSRATTIRIGELVGASEVVFGELRIGEKLSVRARIIDLQTSRQLSDVTDDGPFSDLFHLFERVAGRIAQTLGRRVLATSRISRAIALDAFELYVKGLVASTPAAQVKFLESAMTRAPHDGQILTALWTVYTEQGAHDKALAAASAVPATSRFARRARFDVGLSLIELKRFDGAFKELSALYTQGHAAAISNALGIVQLRRGGVTDAALLPATFFDRATREDPAKVDYLFNLGYARAIAGDAAGALTALREAVRRDAADGDAHLVMSAMLVTTGRTTEAGRELELARLLGTSLETTPAAASARVPPNLERVEVDLNAAPRLDTALAQPAQRDQQQTAAFQLDQARRLIGEQKDREAAVALRRAIYLTPYEDEPHILLGRLHQRAGRLAEAIDEFKVAIWCRETATSRIALGMAFLEAGDKEAARREAERAVALAPTLVEAREFLKRTGGL